MEYYSCCVGPFKCCFLTSPWWDAAHFHWNNNSNLIWDKWCLCLLSTGTTKTIGTGNTRLSRALPSPIHTCIHMHSRDGLMSILQKHCILRFTHLTMPGARGKLLLDDNLKRARHLVILCWWRRVLVLIGIQSSCMRLLRIFTFDMSVISHYLSHTWLSSCLTDRSSHKAPTEFN